MAQREHFLESKAQTEPMVRLAHPADSLALLAQKEVTLQPAQPEHVKEMVTPKRPIVF
jgi:hypothetical protein